MLLKNMDNKYIVKVLNIKENYVMKILAIDLGGVRTGLAICDKDELLASPLCVIEQRNYEKLADQILEIVRKNNVEHLVLGLPKNMDGSEGDSAKRAYDFAELIKDKTGLDVFMKDERGTTITAHNFLNTTDVRGKKRKSVVDAVAATIILQDYLDYRRNHK